MPASHPEVPKAQPWKASWPPANNAAKTSHQYISDDTGALLVDGSHSCTSADLFAELLCSRKDTEPSKAQPWKANWPPAQNAAKPRGHQYISDDAGALLVDGAGSPSGPGGSGDLFAELLCSRNDTEPSKAQPWKANWPPAQNAAKTGHQYITDDTGALLVDGFGSPGGGGGNGDDFFAQLA